MKNLRTGSTTEMTFGGNDKVKRAQIDKKEMQYLYNTGDAFVFMDGKPCWSMNYYGRVIEENFNGDFLKEALLQVDEELPFRGPLFYQKGEYLYLLRIQGKIDFFQGVEEIYYQTYKVYEGFIQGGIVK